jgi:hypothetical protein
MFLRDFLLDKETLFVCTCCILSSLCLSCFVVNNFSISRRVIIETMIVAHLFEIYPAKPSLPCSQQSANGPYSELVESTNFSITFPPTSRSSKFSLSFTFFRIKFYVSRLRMRTTSAAHLIFLDMNTVIFVEEYKLWCYSLKHI